MKWLSLCVVMLIEFTIPVYSQFNLISKPLDPYLIGHSSFNIKEIQLRDRNYLVLLSGLIEKKLKVSEEYFIMDSIISVNTSGGIGKHIFSYYPNFKLFENIWLIKTNNSWYETMKTEYFYDEEGNKYRDLYFDNNSFVWDTSLQINSNYNLLGNLETQIMQVYSGGSWINILKYLYFYDSFGNEVTAMTQQWKNEIWKNDIKINYYYSSANLKDSLILQVWKVKEWQDSLKSVFSNNNVTGFQDSIITSLWDGNYWLNSSIRYVDNDSNGNQILQVDKLWNGNNWENSVQRKYTFNESSYLEEAKCEIWNGINWIPGDDVLLIDNPDGFRIGIITQSISIYYQIVNSQKDIIPKINNFLLFQNYPNPFNPSTKIKFSIPQKENVSLKIYNILGKEVALLIDNQEMKAGEYNIDFSAEGLNSGVYFYTIEAGNYRETKKMILMK